MLLYINKAEDINEATVCNFWGQMDLEALTHGMLFWSTKLNDTQGSSMFYNSVMKWYPLWAVLYFVSNIYPYSC